jgi:poly(3-hydroxybutyrate) depolymerase
MAVEGEKDDISGIGQTLAALDLTPNLPADKKVYHLQKGVGHYGVFNGSRFRSEIAPRIAEFILNQERDARSGGTVTEFPLNRMGETAGRRSSSPQLRSL